MSRMPFPPELFLFIGIDLFVALSLLASLFERVFPTMFPYVYHVAALAGFGQIWVNYTFLLPFAEARFWSCLLYLLAALLNIGCVNFYIIAKKKLLSAAGMFLSVFTVPSFFISLFFISAYVNGDFIPMPWLPRIPIESLYAVLLVCVILLVLSIAVYLEPNLFRRKRR
ncbi:MAG: hypothetical protein QXG09_02535 [Candidatus Bathyarchaeia archaeon]